jgi:hypothetical protein
MSIREQALQLIEQTTGNRNVVIIPRVFIDLMDGDRNAATVLNQVLYWTDRTSHPNGWFYKSYAEWYDELGLSEFQVHRVIWGDPRVQNPKRTLRDVGVEVQLRRSPNGSPTLHYRLDTAIFFGVLIEHLERTTGVEVGSAEPEAAVPDNVGYGNLTEPGMETEQCVASSVIAETSSEKDLIPEDSDETTNFFSFYQEKFGHLNDQLKARLVGEFERLGRESTQQILERCARRGKSWQYVLRALTNEAVPAVRSNRSPNFAKYAMSDDEMDAWLAARKTTKDEPEVAISATVRTPWAAGWSDRPTTTVQDAWDAAFSQLALQLDRDNFESWLRGAVLMDFEVESNTFVVMVRSDRAREMCQHRLYRNIWRVLTDIYGQGLELRFEAMTQFLERSTVAA